MSLLSHDPSRDLDSSLWVVQRQLIRVVASMVYHVCYNARGGGREEKWCAVLQKGVRVYQKIDLANFFNFCSGIRAVVVVSITQLLIDAESVMCRNFGASCNVHQRNFTALVFISR